ncbi:MAG: hypothetical protein E6I26_00520 [Chloroflexi bacterium]|nr:MAG: hypothetical protein E6I26_00520 [Chloroflexota bacterium]
MRAEYVDTGFGSIGYFHAAGELAGEARAAGFVVQGEFGVEGPGCLVTDLEARWGDPARRQAILDAARLVEREPSLLGASHHTLVAAIAPRG